MVDHNLFNLTWKTNLCGVANAQQRDKKVTYIYSMATLWNYSGKNWKPLHSRTRMTLTEDEIFGGVFSKGRHRGKRHSTFFLTKKVGTVIFIEGVS